MLDNDESEGQPGVSIYLSDSKYEDCETKSGQMKSIIDLFKFM